MIQILTLSPSPGY